MADTRNVNSIGRIRSTLHTQFNQKPQSQKHYECTSARLRIDEQVAQDLVSCITEFDCFPFDPASPNLRTLKSATPAPPNLIYDFSTTKQDGEFKLKAYLNESVYSKDKSLHARIKRSKRLTFANAPFSKATGEK